MKNIDAKIEAFKERKIKAKEIFTIKPISKSVAHAFVSRYHYLRDAKFFAKFCYGLFAEDVLVGCATYTNPQGTNALKGWFGLPNDCQDVLELSRLCMVPYLNGSNATSYLLGNSLKLLKSEGVRAVITLADESRHVGSVYQVCNFKYYGLTDPKSDFYTATGKVNPRGSTKGVRGIWVPRTRKHRYCYVMDTALKCLYKEQTRPQKAEQNINICYCGGEGMLFDNRFKEWYSCPACNGALWLIDK